MSAVSRLPGRSGSDAYRVAESRNRWNVDPLLKELRHNPMLWLLALVPVALIAAKLVPDAHTLLFVLSCLLYTSDAADE